MRIPPEPKNRGFITYTNVRKGANYFYKIEAICGIFHSNEQQKYPHNALKSSKIYYVDTSTFPSPPYDYTM